VFLQKQKKQHDNRYNTSHHIQNDFGPNIVIIQDQRQRPESKPKEIQNHNNYIVRMKHNLTLLVLT